MPKAVPTIRIRLVALVLALVVPLAAVAAGGAVLLWRSGEAALEQDLQYRAKALAAVVARELDTVQATLRTLATSPYLTTGDLAAFHAQLAQVPRPEGTRLVLSDRSGRMLVNSHVPFGTQLPLRGDADISRRVFESGQPHVSNLYTSGIASEPIIAVDVPVMRDGRVVYDLEMVFRTAALGRVLEQQKPPGNGWVATLFDGELSVVARAPEMDAFVGRKAREEGKHAFAMAESGVFRSPALDGHPVIAAFSHLPGSRWVVAMGTREAAFKAGLWRSLAAVAAAGGALLLLGLLAAWHQSHRITAAIGALALAPDAATASGVREVDAAARALAAAEAERRRAETALRESEERLRAATDCAHVGLVVVSEEHRYRFANRAYADILGLPTADIVGQRVADVLAPMYETQIRPRLVRAFRGERVEYELTKPAPPGETEAYYAVTYEPGRTASGEPVVLVVITDITERVLAARVLTERESLLRLALDASSLGTWRWDLARGDAVLEWDARCKALSGLSPEATVDHGTWTRTVLPEDWAEAEARLARALDPADPDDTYVSDYRTLHPDGTVLWLEATGRAFFAPDPAAPGGRRAVRLIGTIRDITEARRAAQALRDNEARLRSLAETLEARVHEEVAAREAAQVRLAHAQHMEALGTLAGGIAHDFNNVLQTVQGGTSLIATRPEDTERVRHFARMVLGAAARGAAVTRRMLAFSRRSDLQAEPLESAALLADMREILAHTLGTGIKVRVEADAGLPPLLADRSQLETALVNLATNARDAMSGIGTITLAAAAETLARDHGPADPVMLRAGTYVRLSVADTGAGMEPATLARASEPFFTTKPVGKGTGLGLAMARGFAEQSGGGLRIESAPGLGTVVTLWFPAAPELPTDVSPPAGLSASGKDAKRARLLLVDDESLVREVLAAEMEAVGHSVVPVADGPAALALLDADEPVDLVISDLSMPGMDGIEVIREAQRRRPGVPAILLTGFATDAAEIAVAGAVSETFFLLRKPVQGEALAERVAVLLGEAASTG
ncbi:Histidine kinase (plasmid) [Rhodovastum atsumiense]|uniref:histidine kinase n=1 Tax=Rhodovastum atsumiense TaxID=504468 RepID=A0A5M6IIM7_9PROT|nr:PAS domain S-box protein [Rhodovastum atsumiense]KAA5608131.1 PAS domain S-box protein [Rhodovastum atsumiense]CAH2605811.1 Histidine kinase [Rhodovastum atsumiense]